MAQRPKGGGRDEAAREHQAGGQGEEGAPAARSASAVLRETLQRARLEAPLRSGGLWLFPLRLDGGDGGRHGRCVLLADALAAGTAEVTEVSESGSVPQLVVRNRGAAPVLVPEGEVLVGAKQNRTVNVSLLVAPFAVVVVPVSCVEAGRWHARSRHFAAGGWAHPKLRAAKVASVWRDGRGSLRSDQGRVWDEVAACASDLRVESATSDLHEAMERAFAGPVEPVALPAGTQGVVAVAGGRVIGVDLWGTPEMLATVWPRLWRGYAVEALRSGRREDESAANGATGAARARRFLTRVAAAARPAPQTPGVGEALAIDDPLLAGTALVWEGAVQHVAAFAL